MIFFSFPCVFGAKRASRAEGRDPCRAEKMNTCAQRMTPSCCYTRAAKEIRHKYTVGVFLKMSKTVSKKEAWHLHAFRSVKGVELRCLSVLTKEAWPPCMLVGERGGASVPVIVNEGGVASMHIDR